MLTAQQVPDGYRSGSATTSGVAGYMVTSAVAGTILQVPATGPTTGHPTLWNPSNSGVNIVLRTLSLGYVSGNNAPGSIEWALVAQAGASIGTGLPIVTFTQVTYGTNGATGTYLPTIVGAAAPTPKGLWSPTTNSFTAAPVGLRAAGMSLFTGISSTATTPFTLHIDYDGTLGIAPGNALALCTQMATTTALFQVCITFDEIAATL